ncbi:UDP-N-acetylmuramate dehydrogenase [Nonomuraea soli]|uniref:UDP-N-acetylenolpyruvoylglucosamine reductase n=1 Tax=Nonomuraea soli TaxID=1032476 RepID=A0A7W0CUF6_9ACTN|nr:UDP-N-acetylmuramate dehydrogenase [Nonomuraea soli]MBA2897450.1 UDP-N-acetylmuramate dehydrogenase [Nonomuraea soli]
MILAPYTTLGLGGPARDFVEAASAEELVSLVAQADRDKVPLLILGGGSNLVISDAGFDGQVVRVAGKGISCERDGDQVVVTVEAGEDWDPLVERAVAEGWAGIESMSGIPGQVGSTPIQNVGAYGQMVADTIRSVRVYDRRTCQVVDLGARQCGFAYRDSVFKQDLGRYVVLAVTYALTISDISGELTYDELIRRLGSSKAPLKDVREAVLEIRRGKGMVLDPADPDTRSAGSFFTNPVLYGEAIADLESRSPGHPRWDLPDGGIKVPAAWLIEQAGFTKGYTRGPVRISTKHTLALTNPGDGTTSDLLTLAREVRDGVHGKFGVTLVNEPVLIGCQL